MSPTVRLALVGLAAALAAFAALNPVDVAPWIMAVIAAGSAGLAGVGILPPTWQVTTRSEGKSLVARRRYPRKKRGAKVRAVEELGSNTSMGPQKRMTRMAALAVALLAALAIAPTAAHADFSWGCLNAAPQFRAPGCTNYTVYQPGSSSYLHVGNGMYALALSQQSGGHLWMDMGCNPWGSNTCYWSGHVSTSRCGPDTNRCFVGWLMAIDPAHNFFCREQWEFHGVDTNVYPVYGPYNRYCAYYAP